MFLSTLTPKFYVALTGTSSLISGKEFLLYWLEHKSHNFSHPLGIILIFEWWYFRKYGASFIEQVSLNHISPWISGDSQSDSSQGSTSNGGAGSNGTGTSTTMSECKVWRNPLNLFRGAEYQRFYWATNKEPLTYYDMNLSAQDHQTFFTCEGDAGKAEYEIMQTAWRERNPVVRIKAAHNALEISSDCAPAYILLAEEEATTILESEKLLRTALKIAEANYRKSQSLQHQGSVSEGIHRRDTNVLIYIKRRLAMCARKLGKLKEAVKMFRDLTKEIPPIMNVLNIHENLLEALLEMQAYADCQAVLAKFDDISLPKSATICYTAALLKARAVAEKFSPDIASKRGLSPAEISAVEAIHRAVEFNPHIPRYLLGKCWFSSFSWVSLTFLYLPNRNKAAHYATGTHTQTWRLWSPRLRFLPPKPLEKCRRSPQSAPLHLGRYISDVALPLGTGQPLPSIPNVYGMRRSRTPSLISRSLRLPKEGTTVLHHLYGSSLLIHSPSGPTYASISRKYGHLGKLSHQLLIVAISIRKGSLAMQLDYTNLNHWHLRFFVCLFWSKYLLTRF